MHPHKFLQSSREKEGPGNIACCELSQIRECGTIIFMISEQFMQMIISRCYVVTRCNISHIEWLQTTTVQYEYLQATTVQYEFPRATTAQYGFCRHPRPAIRL